MGHKTPVPNGALTPTQEPRQPAAHETTLRAGLALLAASNTIAALALAFDPSGFISQVGGFGNLNEHLVRDLATWTITYAAALAIAIPKRQWRLPVLAIGVIQGTLHILNHILDAGLAEPDWKGWANVLVLTAVTALTLWLLVIANKQEKPQ